MQILKFLGKWSQSPGPKSPTPPSARHKELEDIDRMLTEGILSKLTLIKIFLLAREAEEDWNKDDPDYHVYANNLEERVKKIENYAKEAINGWKYQPPP